jgi:F0F1-type ATP synthase epsilon subunit
MLTCKIVSENQTTTWEQINTITIPLTSGEVSIWQDHAEMFALLSEGKMSGVNHNNVEKVYQIRTNGGACHIFENTVTVILFDM